VPYEKNENEDVSPSEKSAAFIYIYSKWEKPKTGICIAFSTIIEPRNDIN